MLLNYLEEIRTKDLIDDIACIALFQGKEFETRLKEKKPGNLSDELKTALGMPIGAVSVYIFALQNV